VAFTITIDGGRKLLIIGLLWQQRSAIIGILCHQLPSQLLLSETRIFKFDHLWFEFNSKGNKWTEREREELHK
jgi:hypothetical protein